MGISQDAAEEIGLQALTWLVGNEQLLPVFMGSTGAGETELRQGLTDPGMQAAVLEFILMDDAWVVAFCDQAGLRYEMLSQARAALPGGEQVNWT